MENKNLSKLKLNSEWNIWYHYNKSCWKLTDYKKIFKIKTIQDYWDFHKNLDLIGDINSQHFFMMRDDITPLWEDDKNKIGGSWSIKLPLVKSYDLWIKLSSYIVGETLVATDKLINGLSISTKSNNICVIKIWINDKNQNSINILPKDIISNYGYNIIFKKHVAEY